MFCRSLLSVSVENYTTFPTTVRVLNFVNADVSIVFKGRWKAISFTQFDALDLVKL